MDKFSQVIEIIRFFVSYADAAIRIKVHPNRLPTTVRKMTDDVRTKNVMEAIVAAVVGQEVVVVVAVAVAVVVAVVIVVEAETEVEVHAEVVTVKNETSDEVTVQKPLGSMIRVRELEYSGGMFY